MTPSTSRREVFLLIPSLAGGGAERVFMRIANHLDRRRFQPVVVVGTRGGTYEDALADDVEVIGLAHAGVRHAAREVARLVRQRRPALVLATLHYANMIAALRPVLPAETRVVTRIASTLSAQHSIVAAQRSAARAAVWRGIARMTVALSDAVVCLSDFGIEDTRQELGLRDTDKLVRIYNPVDVDALRARAASKAVERPGQPWIVAVGSLRYAKGHDVLLDALARLKDFFPTLKVTIYGEGPDRAALEAQRARLGLTNMVDLPGFTDNPAAVMARADYMVLSSRYEGFSNVILESLAVGCPVIATDCPSGNRELVLPGVNGWLAPNEDPYGLAKTIAHALKHRDDLQMSATDAFLRQFAVDRVVRAYEALVDPS